MGSDANSDITVFHTISQFENSDLETPDELADSEPSLSTFSRPRPLHFLNPLLDPYEPHSKPYHVSFMTPTYSPFTNERSNN